MALILVCRIGTALCGLPALHVEETLRPRPLQALAGAPVYVRGVALVRGTAMPVVDGGALLFGSALVAAERWVVLRLGARRAVLAVDAVAGLRRLDANRFGALDPLLANDRGPADGSITVDRELLLVLRASKVVPAEVFAAVDEARP